MATLLYDEVIKQIRTKNMAKVYLLHGDEPFFIDRLYDVFSKNVIKEECRDFDLSIVYGQDVSIDEILSEVMCYPMLSDKRLIVIREAQNIANIDRLSHVVEAIADSCILVLCHKKKFDKRKNIYKQISDSGVVFESSKIYDHQLPEFIIGQFKSNRLLIDQQTAYMMGQYIGNNLENIVSEIEKISIAKKAGERITPQDIEDNIGISKDFNVFELQKALSNKDTEKVFQIIFYMSKNEKQAPLPMVLIILFKFFSNLLIVHYMKNKSEKAIAETLKIPVFSTKEYLIAIHNYNAMKCFDIVRQIRMSDAKYKGVDSANASYLDIIKELTVFILN